jgi:hypothetical protein
LKLDDSLKDLIDKNGWFRGSGFKGIVSSEKSKPSDWLPLELPVEYVYRYGQIDRTELTHPPEEVSRNRDRRLFEGWRLLVRRGIQEKDNTNGRIIARLENESYSFKHSVYGINLDKTDDWKRKILTAVLWSSLARYYLFMTSGSWVVWHTEIHLWHLEQLPIRFPDDLELRNRIVTIVDKLRNWDTSLPLFNQSHEAETIASLEHQLDEAIFDLYEFNEAERDLVLDMCEIGLEFFYRHSNSDAVKRLEPYPQTKQGFITDLPGQRDTERGLEGYLYTFLDMWQSYLEPEGVFRWRVVRPDNDPMVAVVFTTQSKHDDLPPLQNDEAMWVDLKQIVNSSRWQINPRIYLDGLVRLVSNDEIIIIKRNERRLWTRSQAREDAEATFLQAMHLQEKPIGV